MSEADKGIQVATNAAGKSEQKRRDAPPADLVPPVGEEGSWLPS